MEKKNRLLQILFSIDSLLPIIYVYLIKENKNIFPKILKEFILKKLSLHLYILKYYYQYKIFILAIIYLIILGLISWTLILLAEKTTSKDIIKKGFVDELEIATDNFLPSYLGYFFVALSIPNFSTFAILFTFIWWFVQKSKQSHFNPIFIILGYKYYFISKEGIKSLLVTKENLRDPKKIASDRLIRINDYTYIDLKHRRE